MVRNAGLATGYAAVTVCDTHAAARAKDAASTTVAPCVKRMRTTGRGGETTGRERGTREDGSSMPDGRFTRPNAGTQSEETVH